MSEKVQPAEQDSPWKLIAGQMLEDLVAFYFPTLHVLVDWQRHYESLDTELARLTRRSATGKRVVDKLVKVFLLNGQEVWILLHIEIQGYYDKKFAQRMHTYHNLISLRYKRQVESMAILTDGNKRFRPSEYQEKGILYETNFKFAMVKLLDYGKDWAKLEQDSNPFALVTMAHLKALELKGRHRDRERLGWKIELVKLLEERNLPTEKAGFLYDFIDAMVQVPEDLDEEFYFEITKKEQRMPFINTIERVVERRALAQGRQEGRQEGQQAQALAMVLRLLKRRFGELPTDLETQITQLDLAALEALGEALLDFGSAEDLTRWLQARSLESNT